MLRLASLIAVLPGLALATPYDGIYRQTANVDCALVGADGGSVKIEDGLFYGVEMQCQMTRPVNVVNMDATLYTFVCSGGDQYWNERVMLMNAAEDDGLLMIWNGYAFNYQRCGD